MGILSSVGKLFTGDVPKQKATESEKAQAEVAGERQQRYTKTYLPLELDAVDQFFDKSAKKFKEAVIDRTLSADAARAEQGTRESALQAAALSGTTLSSSANNTGLTEASIGAGVAQGLGATQATALAQDLRDKEGVGIIRTGRDVSRSTSTGLSSLARQSNFSASNALRNKMEVNRAKAKALGDIIISSGAAAYQGYQDAKDATTESYDLSGAGRLAREKFGVGAEENRNYKSMSAALPGLRTVAPDRYNDPYA